MKFATERTGAPDGRLLVVSHDMSRCVPSIGIAATLQDALDRWDAVNEDLRALYDRLNDDKIAAAMPFDPALITAPLPRAWQWLDGSAYSTHGRLMQRAYGLPPIETRLPLMYQGMSHRFLGPMEDVFLPSEADGIDFEAELGIITGAVPMGATATNALSRIRLAVQINDWSLRTLAAAEMKTGFGWVQAKPACSMAPVAVTLDELGDSWRDGRIDALLNVGWNGITFGAVPTYQMEFGFHDLIAHAARTRDLCAGTIIGSGTVSSDDYAQLGSCCIAERRAIEMIEHGETRTDFMRFGDRVAMSASPLTGNDTLFGRMDQQVGAKSQAH